MAWGRSEPAGSKDRKAVRVANILGKGAKGWGKGGRKCRGRQGLDRGGSSEAQGGFSLSSMSLTRVGTSPPENRAREGRRRVGARELFAG